MEFFYNKQSDIITNKDKRRNSALELLRIICMILIIMHHFAVHGGYNLEETSTLNILWVQFLSLGGKLGVNCFIMISGYFLINSTFKIKKLIKLLVEVWFYSIVIYLIFIFTGYIQFSVSNLFVNITPILHCNNGFATTYVLLYILSPYINKFLLSLTKTQYKKFLTILFVIWSVIPTFTTIEFQYLDLIWFIIIYSFAAYIRLFPCNFFDKCKLNFFIAILNYLFIFLFALFIDIIARGNTFLIEHGTYFKGVNKVPLFIASFTLFLAFKNMNIKYNKYINIISATTFGIYLIHDNPNMRIFLWKHLFKCSELVKNNYFIIYSIFIIIAVFVVCSLIDKLRIVFIENYFLLVIDNLKQYNIYSKFKDSKIIMEKKMLLIKSFLNK